MYNYTNNFSQNAGHLASKKIIYFHDEINLFMERRPIDINNPQINNNRNVIVKASDILKKLRTNPNNNGNVINLNLGENDNILNEDVIGNDDD